MVQVKEGKLIGSGAKFGIVVARFNEFICSKLLGGAYDALHRHGVDDADITTAWVPGAFEIPLIAQKMAESGKYDAVICLGAVIRGATSTMTWSAANRLKASPRHPLRRASPSCSASSRRKTSNRLSNGWHKSRQQRLRRRHQRYRNGQPHQRIIKASEITKRAVSPGGCWERQPLLYGTAADCTLTGGYGTM